MKICIGVDDWILRRDISLYGSYVLNDFINAYDDISCLRPHILKFLWLDRNSDNWNEVVIVGTI